MASKEFKLLLIRHGQGFHNLGIYGREELEFTEDETLKTMNSSLTEKGLNQARLVGERLKNKKFDLVISSDLKRAKQTAEIIVDLKKDDYITKIISNEIKETSESDLLEKKYVVDIDSFEEYGEWKKEKIMIMDKKQLESVTNKKVKVGEVYEFKLKNNSISGDTKMDDIILNGVCVKEEGNFKFIDFNHPMAGKHCKISFKILEIIDNK